MAALGRSSQDETGTPTSKAPSLLPERFSWVSWLVLAAFLAPLSVVLHESAHYAVGRFFHFPGLVPHLTGVTFLAGATGHPNWQRALGSAAGPLMTLLLAGIGCAEARRTPVRAWAVIIGLAASARTALISVGFLLVTIRGGDTSHIDSDEATTARLLHISPLPIMLLSFTLGVGALGFLLARLPNNKRVAAIASVAAGAVIGLFLYSRIGA